jgi:repressor of nif and glnA expression
VRCPKCGHIFSVEILRENPKGTGAHYGRVIKKLSPLHKEILLLLSLYGPMPKRRIASLLHERGIRLSGNSLSGRLSELLGAGYVKTTREAVKLYDEKSMQFRYVRLPVWSITEKGKNILK